MLICAATNNQGKLKELRRILEAQGHEVKSLKELDIHIDPEETGETFAENAFIKANAAFKATGMPAIADDSGLSVDALDGRPGVYSARYCGENATDEEKYTKLLEEMQGVPDEKRTAHFTSAICCILSDKEKIEVDGICNGTISHTPNGNGGFGYDPIFDCNGKSFAELTAEEKDKISHRGIALRKLQAELKNRFYK